MFNSTKDDLKKILERVHDGQLQLPDFQRDYVWNDEDIKSLVASVAKGFPVGALLTLQTGGEVRFKPRALEGAKPDHDRPDVLLLDGQQRMTSMYQATFGRDAVKTKTPKGKLVHRFYYLDIQRALQAGADLGEAIIGVPGDRIVRSNFGRTVDLDLSTSEKEYQNDHFPLNQVFDSRDWFYGWRDYWREQDRDRAPDEKAFVKLVLERIERYEMPIIELDRANSREAICLVFEKVNVGGKKLDAFELLTAVYAADEFDLREDWRGTGTEPGRKDRIVGLEHRRDVLRDTSAMDVLQACSILYTRDLRATARAEGKEGKELPQVSCTRASVLALPKEAYEQYADAVEAGYRAAASFSNELDVYWKRDVPYPSLTLALAAVHAILGHEARTAAAKEKMSRWYWSVALGELYGSSTESRLARDVPELVRWVRGGEPPRALDEALFQTSRFRSLRSRNAAAYKAIHALLMDRGARDFSTGKKADLMTAHDDQIDIHHVFPQKWCKAQGIPPSAYNSVLNKTPLSRRTNQVIGGDAPSVYLRKIEEKEGLSPETLDAFLRSHLLDPALVRADNFEGAMTARSAALAGLVSDAMGKPVVDTEATNEPETEALTESD